MQAARNLSLPHSTGAPCVEALSTILKSGLRGLLEGEGDLPRSAREGSAAALVLLDPQAGPDDRFPLAHYRGDQPFFPSHLAALFYLAGVQLKIQREELACDENVERDVLRMLRTGDTDAANLIFD